ncbi:hypothetical protein ACFORJ_11135 [Corynebacterium hansenii]|uniref:DUF4190 domain-containing protein n=1 Tax=Corynebacterium hansenii TaxID=394964 RepID=A0ABV7ZS59_9CORY|nr:hypothetical protein [Corynebacterium hansenii]WJY99856.1 hypothetical protein CHAN_06185 [Corynebacterium hansenii]
MSNPATDGYGPDGIDGSAVGRKIGLVSLVIGIGALITSAFVIGAALGMVAVVLGLIAIVQSIGAHKRIEQAGREPRTGGAFGMGLIGVITGGLAIAISLALIVAAFNFFEDAEEKCGHLDRTSPEYAECLRKLSEQ